MQPTLLQTQPRVAQALPRALVLLLTLLVAACSSPQPTPTPAPTPAPQGGACILPAQPDTEATLRALLDAEGTFVVSQEIDSLMQLWADDAKIVDARNTPDETSDDQVWEGRDAIRNRYVRIVFPGAPAAVDHSDQQITLDASGNQAVVESTTAIGNEIAPAGDRWELVLRDGCWYIFNLTYNLEPAP
jgi:hypothetical protein